MNRTHRYLSALASLIVLGAFACGDDETTDTSTGGSGAATTTTTGGQGGDATGPGGSGGDASGGSGGDASGGGGMGGDGGTGGMGGGTPGIVDSGVIVWGDYDVVDQVDVAHAVYDGAGQLTLTKLPVSGLAGAFEIQAVAVSPDGSQLAVAGRATSTSNAVINVYAGNGAGTPVTVADASNGANTDATFHTLSWSADGSMIAFISDREVVDRDRGYVVAADGLTAPKLVTQDPDSISVAKQLIWATATHVAYTGAFTNARTCIYAVDVTAMPIAPAELAPCSTFSSQDDVFTAVPLAADGAGNVYFMADHELGNVQYRLYRNNAATPTAATQVPGTALLDGGNNERAISTFGLSPTGDRVAIGVGDTAGLGTAFNVHVVTIATQAVTQVTSGTASAYQGVADTASPIRWSPDGTTLATRAHFDGAFDFDIFVVPSDGSTAAVKVFDSGLGSIYFSPDSSRIFTTGGGDALSTTDFTTADQAFVGATLLDPVGSIHGFAPIP